MSHALALLLVAIPAAAQTTLTLADAVRTAIEKHPSIKAAGARSRAAEYATASARSGYLPKAQYSEFFYRSDNPVFVFSSLLTQRRFAESNFAIGALNRPGFFNNFQSQVSVAQTVFDWGGIRSQVRTAEINRDISQLQERRIGTGLIANVVQNYYAAALATDIVEVARAALKSAESDLNRAEAVLGAGRSTTADVASIRVHLAAVRETAIRRRYEAEVAVAALNQAMGLPLDTQHRLQALQSPVLVKTTASAMEEVARKERTELHEAATAVTLAEQERRAARASLLPAVVVSGVFEADRSQFVRHGGGNWTVAAGLKWNLFDGNAARSQMAASEARSDAARAAEREVGSRIALEVRRAWAELRSADERIAVASAAVTEAEESLRITKDRYDASLATVTDLLRTEAAVLDARTRSIAAVYEQRMAAAALELAAGTLSANSEVLR